MTIVTDDTQTRAFDQFAEVFIVVHNNEGQCEPSTVTYCTHKEVLRGVKYFVSDK